MPQYDYNKNEIKFNLSLDQMMDILVELDADPVPFMGDIIHCKTVCHGGNSSKLYYYDNTKLFKCYTDCADSFDIFELVRKIKSREENKEWQLPKAVQWVADFFSITGNETDLDVDRLDDWDVFDKYDRIKEINRERKIVELQKYDCGFLKNLPRPAISSWLNEGITKSAMDYFDICYEPKNQCVVIPHKDINGDVIGIRQRTLIKEVAEKYGKYRPLKLGKVLYNHPLSFNLYGLYQNQDNIRRSRRAFVFEGEKSVLQMESFLGRENNCAVACCGSSFIQYQAWLLISLGVEEIIICLDKQYKEFGDKEHEKLVKNLKGIHKKYGHFVRITYIFDKEDLLPYKASPTDRGKDTFLELYKKRVNIYNTSLLTK